MSFYICNVILSNAKNLYKAFWRCFDFAQHDKASVTTKEPF